MANLAGGSVVGAINLTSVTVTAAYTAVEGVELILADATAGAFTVKLPKPTKAGVLDTSNPQNGVTGQGNVGQRVNVIKVDTGGNAVTVDGLLPSYLRAGGKATLANNGSSAVYVSDGTFWNAEARVS